ncbi:MAG: DUF4105 domain-containing protein [Bacteroidota bacterium]
MFHSLKQPRLYSLIAFWGMLTATLIGQPLRPLSPSAQISLMTCAPGEDLYSAFGHSAVRVYDSERGIDSIYNYGTFDFDPPGFYVDFVKGKLNYRLNRESYRMFDRIYRYFERSYQAQELNLTYDQKVATYQFLENNAKPENAYYLYDFFYDNCATRIRDLMVEILGDSLRYHQPHQVGDSTLRDILDQYIEMRAWSDFGIDLALGAVIDDATTPWIQMFHPDYLAWEFAKAEVYRNGSWQPLVQQTYPIYTDDPAFSPTPWYLHPWFLFGLILLTVAAFTWLRRSQQPTRLVGDGILFSLAGLGGLVLFLLTFATDHTATAANWNLFWLIPTHLVAAIWLFRSKRPAWLRWYFGASAGIIVLLLLCWTILPQALSTQGLPLMLLLLLRSAIIWRKG